MRNSSPWSNIVFEKEVIFHELDFETSDFRIWGLEIKQLKAHNFVWQGCFCLQCYLATSTPDWAQIFTFFFIIICICWDTPSEKTGHLAITNSVLCLEVIGGMGSDPGHDTGVPGHDTLYYYTSFSSPSGIHGYLRGYRLKMYWQILWSTTVTQKAHWDGYCEMRYPNNCILLFTVTALCSFRGVSNGYLKKKK